MRPAFLYWLGAIELGAPVGAALGPPHSLSGVDFGVWFIWTGRAALCVDCAGDGAERGLDYASLGWRGLAGEAPAALLDERDGIPAGVGAGDGGAVTLGDEQRRFFAVVWVVLTAVADREPGVFGGVDFGYFGGMDWLLVCGGDGYPFVDLFRRGDVDRAAMD